MGWKFSLGGNVCGYEGGLGKYEGELMLVVMKKMKSD